MVHAHATCFPRINSRATRESMVVLFHSSFPCCPFLSAQWNREIPDGWRQKLGWKNTGNASNLSKSAAKQMKGRLFIPSIISSFIALIAKLSDIGAAEPTRQLPTSELQRACRSLLQLERTQAEFRGLTQVRLQVNSSTSLISSVGLKV